MTFRFPIEAGGIRLFARSLGDEDPRWDESTHLADSTPLLAPPTFVASAAHFDPEWEHRPRPGIAWHGSAAGPGTPPPAQAGGGTSLHAEQHYEYHVPVQAGDVLTVERRPGRRWEKQSARAGRLVFEEEITEFTNQRGELAVTATRVRVITEKVVSNS